ncbi:MAG: DUF3391 domain-containing protein, partial [Halioglobus sp.]|nr:DUF3391 domain-containing protein [Halioglobus sp.]
MHLVKLEVMNLRPGMFIAQVDRPWLETPFLTQGFVVQDSKEIDFIANHVDYVYVDTDYKGYEHAMELAIKDPEPAQNRREVIGREYRQAKINFASAAATLDNVYDTLREGKGVDIHKVKQAVSPLIESVFRNAEAVAALVRLKESG